MKYTSSQSALLFSLLCTCSSMCTQIVRIGLLGYGVQYRRHELIPATGYANVFNKTGEVSRKGKPNE